ncbi:GyrI-like domain-containing protein [Sphingomonas sp. QA11]|uniref:GyrI-like domain-containing protein n=1 Tax=Sphingomonas sp. QA11 TaxID=2950605 RepID=UPI00234B8875|nr:GyrI-like domain-containing protein [Sphingomonas sp. QA11]WCM27384.1 GyrI-like domain-containing protein [Sphingomonas sp. QA11]
MEIDHMLSLPQIVHRTTTPYVAIKAQLTLPFGNEVSTIIGRLFGLLEQERLAEEGPIFFRHNLVAMPLIEMEIGVPTNRVIEQRGDIVSGLLPAGRYAEVTYFGPYDDLVTVNGVLMGWASHVGLEFDSKSRRDGEWFANRLEIYHNSPAEEPDARKLKTSIAIKLVDEQQHGGEIAK